jgi:hypothetical protein
VQIYLFLCQRHYSCKACNAQEYALPPHVWVRSIRVGPHEPARAYTRKSFYYAPVLLSIREASPTSSLAPARGVAIPSL